MNTPPRYLRIAALVLLLAAGRVGPAGAAQAGGLPELSAQVKALQAAVAALQAAVVNLQNAPVYSVTGPSVGLRILARDVATLDVPAGQYWIVFTSTVTNTTSDIINPTDTIGCAIFFTATNATRSVPNCYCKARGCMISPLRRKGSGGVPRTGRITTGFATRDWQPQRTRSNAITRKRARGRIARWKIFALCFR